MRFFKKRKKSSETSGLFSLPAIRTIFNEEKRPSTDILDELELNKVVFDQAAELYTKARNILKDTKPTDLDEEAKKEYFSLLWSAYERLLSRAHIKEIYISHNFCKLFLLLHKDLAVCYSEGIGVQPDDFERRRHLVGVGYLLDIYASMEVVRAYR